FSTLTHTTSSPLFPYTTLFRSTAGGRRRPAADRPSAADRGADPHRLPRLPPPHRLPRHRRRGLAAQHLAALGRFRAAHPVRHRDCEDSSMTVDLDRARQVVRTALEEDLRYGPDATTAATVPADAVAEAAFNTRRAGVVAGLPVVRLVLDEVLGPDGYSVLETRSDGDRLAPGDCLLRVEAPVQGLLTAERTALNLLCHLSGVATATAERSEEH